MMRFRTLWMLLVVAAVSLVAVAALALDLLPGGSFTDDNGNIHEGNIEAIAAEGITRGCNPPVSDRFCPNSGITRGQMAAFLTRALDLPTTAEDFFTDDDGSTFEGDINRLAAAGITRGCNPPDFDHYCPSGIVSRGQMAAFLVRGFGYDDRGSGDVFIDDDGSTFEEDIDRLAVAGVTKGCNPPTFDRYCPDAPVRRDQMASFLARALDLTPIIPPPPPPPPPPPADPEVFAIGDSVMRGVACNPAIPPCYSPSLNLEGEIPKLTSDASVSRPFSQADNVLSAWLAKGHEPDVVVVHLGTNGPPSAAQFDDVMAKAGTSRRVLFLTVKLDKSWESATNAAIRSNVRRFANAELVDWWALSDPHPEWFAADVNCGCHLWSSSARTAYVNLVKNAVAS
ncbi:MAG: hypothetical protein U9R51_08980 [Actinomycetota bacterium]|nr:hypothetical protein [Actinomycetota bacterium]